MSSIAVLRQMPWLDRVALLAAALVPLVSLVAPLGLTSLLLVTASLALAAGPRLAIIAAIPRGPALLVAAFLLWGLVSATWAIEPAVSVYKFGQLLFLFAAGLVLVGAFRGVLQPETRVAAGMALAIGVAVVLLLLLVEAASGSPIARLLHPQGDLDAKLLLTRHNRVATVLVIVLAPASFALGQCYHRRAGIALFAVGIAVLALLHSRTSIVAALASGAVILVAWRWRRLSQVAVALAVAGSLFVIPLVPSAVLGDAGQVQVIREEARTHNVFSFFHRLRIWEFVVQRIEDRPILGWGLDSSRSLPGGKEPSDAAGERLSLHPHNAALQIRVELGIPGLLLAAALILWPVVRLYRYSGDGAPIVLGVALAASIVASMSYGIWQSWWMAALWLAVALTALSCPPASDTT